MYCIHLCLPPSPCPDFPTPPYIPPPQHPLCFPVSGTVLTPPMLLLLWASLLPLMLAHLISLPMPRNS